MCNILWNNETGYCSAPYSANAYMKTVAKIIVELQLNELKVIIVISSFHVCCLIFTIDAMQCTCVLLTG